MPSSLSWRALAATALSCAALSASSATALAHPITTPEQHDGDPLASRPGFDFRNGFAILAADDRAAEHIGQPIEAEHPTDDGYMVQRTTGGLLLWKPEIPPQFTDGFQRYGLDQDGRVLEWAGDDEHPPTYQQAAAFGASAPLYPYGVFDALASCESGQRWNANTGNGYYGGIQEDLKFWINHGGLAYADRPDHASREAQIQVGINGRDGLVGQAQGWRAWPACSLRLGLRR